MGIKHDLPFQKQSTSSNCVQTSTSQLLSFYGIDLSPADIEKEVPVRKNSDNKPMGTLFADIGSWIKSNYELQPVMHVFDSQVIDRSWKELTQAQILSELVKLQNTGIETAFSPYVPLHINAYIDYLKSGGKIRIEKCTNELLQRLLAKGPVLTIVSFNYLYDYPRVVYDQTKKNYVSNPQSGKVIEHAIVLTGYHEGAYFYNDPDAEYGGRHKVQDDVLIGAICSAQINSDNYLLTLER